MALLRAAIGRVLRRIRQAQGRTLQDVADTAGVSMAYLSEVERGRKEVSSELLAVICRALGIALPDLLDEVRSELLRRTDVRLRWFSCAGVRRHPPVVTALSRHRPH